MRVRAAGATRRGLDRPINCDALLANDELGLYAVADSVGVQPWEITPARRTLDLLADFLSEHSSAGAEDLLKSAIVRANTALFRIAQSDPQSKGSTTLTACLVRDGACVVGHAGDSAAFLFRQRKLRRITTEDTLAGLLLQRGLISPTEALRHPGRNQVLNCLGEETDLTVHTWPIEVRKGDLLLLCSDGVARRLTEETLLAEASPKGVRFARLAGRLVSLARKSGVRDDLTALALKFTA